MKNLFLAVVVGFFLLLGGCASKNGLFSPDKLAQRALGYTKKAEIYNSLEIKASLVATYLNPLVEKYSDKENAYFLVSVFIDNDFADPQKQGLKNPDITLRLEAKAPKSIEELKKGDELIKIAPIQNVWSHYYLVTFPKPASTKFTLEIKSQRYGASSSIFEVDPRE